MRHELDMVNLREPLFEPIVILTNAAQWETWKEKGIPPEHTALPEYPDEAIGPSWIRFSFFLKLFCTFLDLFLSSLFILMLKFLLIYPILCFFFLFSFSVMLYLAVQTFSVRLCYAFRNTFPEYFLWLIDGLMGQTSFLVVLGPRVRSAFRAAFVTFFYITVRLFVLDAFQRCFLFSLVGRMTFRAVFWPKGHPTFRVAIIRYGKNYTS